jgi:catechol-2,3-dioxygenase
VELASRALLVDDLVLAERFYADVLGKGVFGRGSVDSRYLLSTDELLELRRRAVTRPASAPPDFWSERPPYTNVTVGSAKVSLYTADRHVQEPPPEQLRGAPRMAFTASTEELDRATTVFVRLDVAFEGPVEHPAQSRVARSLYFKDPAGNFLELCELADG